MTVTTSTVQDILESAAAVIVGGVVPTGTGAPAAWREWLGTDLRGAADRHFEIVIDSEDDTVNTKVDAQAAITEWWMRFTVRLKLKMEAKIPRRKRYGFASRDAKSIRNRVAIHLSEKNTAYATSGGALVSTALNGVRACTSGGAITYQPGEDPSTLYVEIPFLVEFSDSYVTT